LNIKTPNSKKTVALLSNKSLDFLVVTSVRPLKSWTIDLKMNYCSAPPYYILVYIKRH